MQKSDSGNWIKISQAAKLTGTSERTLRRWATGRTKSIRLETRLIDGQMLVDLEELRQYTSVSDTSPTAKTTADKSDVRTEIKAAAQALQEKETEIVRLNAVIEGKNELLKELQRSNERLEQSISRLENVILQIQTAFAAARSEAADKVFSNEATKAIVQEIAPDVARDDSISPAPLHYAAYKGDVEKVRSLLREGISPNVTNGPGYTPLHYAALQGQHKIVEILADAGADTGAKDPNGWTPLHGAALKDQLDITRYLLSTGADPNQTDNLGNTALHAAAANGNHQVVEILLVAKADPSIKNIEGKTPLALAREKSAENVIDTLLLNGTTD